MYLYANVFTGKQNSHQSFVIIVLKKIYIHVIAHI